MKRPNDSAGYNTAKYIKYLESRIQSMQEVVDAAIKYHEYSDFDPKEGCCPECDLLLTIDKYKAIKEG